jgi:ribose 5-phosphate isomerase B
MTVYIGADHGGFAAKEQLKEQLRQQGYEVEDCGNAVFDPNDDYTIFGVAVAQAVARQPGSKGIAICRSGHGMVIAANKINGARAILAVNEASAVQSRAHDNANVLAIGIDFMDERQVWPITSAWLRTEFLGGRHQRRLDEIKAIEEGKFSSES